MIMDEVGRGTTVDDGLAIAFATVHHLLTVNKCRAMFATHFHELADMLGYEPNAHKGQGPFDKVAFFCTDLNEVEVRSPCSDAEGFFAEPMSFAINRTATLPTHTVLNLASPETAMGSRLHNSQGYRMPLWTSPVPPFRISNVVPRRGTHVQESCAL